MGTPGESSSVMSSNSKGAMEKLPAEKISRSIGSNNINKFYAYIVTYHISFMK